MRLEQMMRVDEIHNCFRRDMDAAGYIIDEAFLVSRGLTGTTTVRFTTNSIDQFDGESFAEIQAVIPQRSHNP